MQREDIARYLYGNVGGDWTVITMGPRSAGDTSPPERLADMRCLGDPAIVVRDLVDDDGWTQTALAAELGVTQQAVSRWCRHPVQIELTADGWSTLAALGYGLRFDNAPVYVIPDLGFPGAGWDIVNGRPEIVVDASLCPQEQDSHVRVAQANIRALRRRHGGALPRSRGLVTAAP